MFFSVLSYGITLFPPARIIPGTDHSIFDFVVSACWKALTHFLQLYMTWPGTRKGKSGTSGDKLEKTGTDRV